MPSRNLVTIWIMWFLGSFFYAYQYILRVLPGIMMPDILTQFKIDASQFGQFSGLYYVGYAGMHIPLGLLLDKYGAKTILPVCILLTALGLAPLIYCESWIFAASGRILIGMGSSAAILGLFKIIRLSFPEEKFTLILGCSVTIGLLGAIYGGQPVNYFMHLLGWQRVIEGILIIGVILAITTFWIIPHQARSTSNQSWYRAIKSVLAHPTIIIICMLAGFMVGPLEGFADVWGVEYLKSAYHLEDTMAATFPSLIFLGMCFGSPLLSWAAQRSRAYFEYLVASAFIMGIAFVLLLTGHLTVQLMPMVFFIIGIFCAYQILAIYQASTYAKKELVGLTTACANMIIMAFGYFFHTLIGKLMMLNWKVHDYNGITPNYDAITYTKALMIIPAGLLIGGVGFSIIAIMRKKKSLYQ